jgi:hypothetical protein
LSALGEEETVSSRKATYRFRRFVLVRSILTIAPVRPIVHLGRGVVPIPFAFAATTGSGARSLFSLVESLFQNERRVLLLLLLLPRMNLGRDRGFAAPRFHPRLEFGELLLQLPYGFLVLKVRHSQAHYRRYKLWKYLPFFDGGKGGGGGGHRGGGKVII